MPKTAFRGSIKLRGGYRFALATLAGLTVASVTPTAFAQKRTPAPIEFARPGNTYAQPGAYNTIQTASLPRSSRRVEYRYPDHPDFVYGESGVRRIANSAQPIAFSSSEAAVDINAARRVSGSISAPAPARDPALTSGSFDARAAAATAISLVKQVKLPNLGSSRYARQKVGAPYEINGKWYVPTEEPNYDEIGTGSWYGPQFHGRAAATGEIFDQNAMTAAHPTLPIPSLARVTNLDNGRTTVVRINDRGPFVDDRIIDLSKQAATVLGYKSSGTANVRVQYMGPAPVEPNSVPAEYAVQSIPTQQSPVMPAQSYGHAKLTPAMYQSTLAQAAPSDGFLVQAGSFTELANAHALRAKLQDYGPVFVKEASVGGRELFRVYLGPWPTRQDAATTKHQVKRAGISGIVVKSH